MKMCSCRFNYDYYVCFYLGFGNIWAHILSRWVGVINSHMSILLGSKKKKIWAYYWHYFIICLTACNWVGTCYLFLYVSINDTTLLFTSNNLSFSSCEKIMKKVVTYYFIKPLSLTFSFHLFLHFGWTCFLSSYSFQCWIYGYLQVDFRMVTIMFWLIWNKES